MLIIIDDRVAFVSRVSIFIENMHLLNLRLRNIAQYGCAVLGRDLHWILRYVQTLVNTEEDIFEEL